MVITQPVLKINGGTGFRGQSQDLMVHKYNVWGGCYTEHRDHSTLTIQYISRIINTSPVQMESIR